MTSLKYKDKHIYMHMKITFENKRDWFVSVCALMCGIWSAVGMVFFITWSLFNNWVVRIGFNLFGEGPMEYALALFALGMLIYLLIWIAKGEIKNEHHK